MSLFPRTSVVAVVFVLSYQSIADELYASHDKSVDATAVSNAYQRVCTGILGDIKSAGFSHVTLCAADKDNFKTNPLVPTRPSSFELLRFVLSPFCLQLFNVFIQDMATSLGLTATEQDYSIMYPTPLFSKPVLCVQDFNETIRAYATKGTFSFM